MRAQLRLKMSTTPWWERKEAEIQAERGADAACSVSSSTTVRISPSATPPLPRFSTPEDLGHDPDHPSDPPPRSIRMQYSCRTAPDENGVMRRKCERIVKKFRQCPGAPRECLEETREETDETNATSGGMMPGGSSSSSSSGGGGFESHQEFFKTWEGTLGGGGSMFPFGGMLGALFGDEPPGGNELNKDRSEDAGRMNDRRPGFVERAMEDAVGGMFRGLFREMEREMERTMERRPDDGAAGGPPPATRDDDWSRGSRRA